VGEWRYVKSDNFDAAKAITRWLVRDSKYVLVINPGPRNNPRNHARAGVGVGLRAADAQGVRVMSSYVHA
jgi:DNA-binding LacI/PurR family transcriptional regulator